MRRFKAPGSESFEERSIETAAQRRAALIRLITYARDEARRLDADVLAFCLEAAVAAAFEDYAEDAPGSKPLADGPGASLKRAASEPVH